MTTYTYSLTTDFKASHQVNEQQLTYQIWDAKLASGNLLGISTDGDSVYITFDAKLSVPDKGTLDNIVANFVPDIDRSMFVNLVPYTITTTALAFEPVLKFLYSGVRNTFPISEVDVISDLSIGIGSYTVRLQDVTNGLTIATGTFTNTGESINKLTLTASNLPKNPAQFELQVQVNLLGLTAAVRAVTYYVNPSMLPPS